MDRHELHDAGFTEGYSHGSAGTPKRLGAPIELVLLAPEQIMHWRNAYEHGFAKGKTDRHQLMAWRAAQRTEARARGDQTRGDREHDHER